MAIHASAASEVFSAREIARAAGVSLGDARAAIEAAGEARHSFYSSQTAVHIVRLLRHDVTSEAERPLFAPRIAARRSPMAGVTGSGAMHAGIACVLALLSLSFSKAEELPRRLDPARLVFVATPGPGGGGGGGGLKQPAPPPKAEMKSAAALKSPVPPPRPLSSRKPEPVKRPDPPPVPTPKPVDPPPPPPPPAVTPQVVAPVATAAADPRDRAGVLSESTATTESQGPGSGAGVGTGQGTGIGEGSGAGIGPGSGGGTGGGPYRPGSGITPPQLLREVKPEYTEEARRLGLAGDVVLEIVVRHDGTVGDVKVMHGLGGGLDRRAIDAVRQWRFAPARRFGTPVDVLVEVAVEFKLR